MRDGILAVDEGVEDNMREICMVLDITGGGSVTRELTIELVTIEGTASESK